MQPLLRTRHGVFRELPWRRALPLVHSRSLKKLHPKDTRSKYDKKVEIALEQWNEHAVKVRNGEHPTILSILEERGFVNAIAGDRDQLNKSLTDERIGAYVGIDPTAPSLHLGNLLPLMALLWMFIHGYETVTLIGGATAAVGDPSGKTTARQPMNTKTRRANLAAMHVQTRRLWQKMEAHATQRHGYVRDWAWRRNLWNNNEWLSKTSIYQFMSQIGTGMRIGPLLGRDSVKQRMENDSGVSFAELSYPLLQAWDWWHMYQRRGISLQIGGSDQYGNIISGMDALGHLRRHAANYAPDLAPEYKNRGFFGLTVPLLTTSSGEKFGKSANNAIWLDEELTKPIELYQFLLRSADADVERYLRLFTLLPMTEISSIMEEHELDRSKRIPQRRLAKELVSMIHSQGACDRVESELSALYQGHRSAPATSEPSGEARTDGTAAGQNPTKTAITAENAGGTRSFLPRSAVENKPFSAVLYAAGLSASRSEANRLIIQGGAYVGSEPASLGGRKGGMTESLKFMPIEPWRAEETARFFIDDSLIIIRVGKWKVKIIEMLPDIEYLHRGLPMPPGWKPAWEPRKEPERVRG